MAQMSSSTFSRSLLNVPVNSSPNMSTHSFCKRVLLVAPMAICWIPSTLNGRMTSDMVITFSKKLSKTELPALYS